MAYRRRNAPQPFSRELVLNQWLLGLFGVECFAQRFGLGAPLARQALEANGNPPPEFGFQRTLVVATVRAAP